MALVISLVLPLEQSPSDLLSPPSRRAKTPAHDAASPGLMDGATGSDLGVFTNASSCGDFAAELSSLFFSLLLCKIRRRSDKEALWLFFFAGSFTRLRRRGSFLSGAVRHDVDRRVPLSSF